MSAFHESAATAFAVIDPPPVVERLPSFDTPQIVNIQDARPQPVAAATPTVPEPPAHPARTAGAIVWFDFPDRDAKSFELGGKGFFFAVFV